MIGRLVYKLIEKNWFGNFLSKNDKHEHYSKDLSADQV